MKDKEYRNLKKRFKDAYENMLSKEELKDLYSALKVLELSFSEYTDISLSVAIPVADADRPLTTTDIVKADLYELVEEKYKAATPEELKILDKFNLLSLKIPYLFVEIKMSEGDYEKALEVAQSHSQVLNGFIVRFRPDEPPAVVYDVLSEYKRIIPQLQRMIQDERIVESSQPSKVKPARTRTAKPEVIDWTDPEGDVSLKRLSIAAYNYGITKRFDDIEFMIKKQRIIDLKVKPAYVANLLFRLSEDQRIFAPNGAFFGVAEKYIRDSSKEVAKNLSKNCLKNLSYKINSKILKNHGLYTQKVDAILTEAFPKRSKK